MTKPTTPLKKCIHGTPERFCGECFPKRSDSLESLQSDRARPIEALRVQVTRCRSVMDYGRGIGLTVVHGACCGDALTLLRELARLRAESLVAKTALKGIP